MKLTLIKVLCALTALAASTAFANQPGDVTDDSALVAAVGARKNDFYVEAGNLVVTKILPDDTSGLPHQKWQARLSNGDIVTIVYNSDMGVRVPVHIGESFSAGGQFIWTPQGGLLHWLHDDPRHQRPDGYVLVNGVVYGDTDHEDGARN